MAQSQQTPNLNERDVQVFEAFKYLNKTRGTPTQSELASFLGCGTATVNRAIKRLKQSGDIGADTVNTNNSPRSYRVTNFRRSRKVRNG